LTKLSDSDTANSVSKRAVSPPFAGTWRPQASQPGGGRRRLSDWGGRAAWMAGVRRLQNRQHAVGRVGVAGEGGGACCSADVCIVLKRYHAY
jgi:hypothetical protein